MKVARVDQCQQKILEILADENVKIAYSADLKEQKARTGRSLFSESIVSKGLSALHVLIQKGNEKAKVEGWSGFATSAFRNAENGKKTLNVLSAATGVNLHLISQDQEGALGYIGGSQVGTHDPKTTIVWDIGGGSQQFSYRAEDGAIKVIKLEDLASEKFKELLIKDLKKTSEMSVNTPNPIGLENRDLGVALGVKFAETVGLPFVPSEVIGIGGVHAKSISKALRKNGSYTRNDLKNAEFEFLPKNDAEVNDAFADTFVSNLLLVDGMMEGLCLEDITISPYSSTDAALVYPSFWDAK